MPKYLYHGSYTDEGLKGLMKDGGTINHDHEHIMKDGETINY